MTMVWCEGFETFGLGVTNAEIQDVYDLGGLSEDGQPIITPEAEIVAGRDLDGYSEERALRLGMLLQALQSEDGCDMVKLPLGGLSQSDDWIVGVALRLSGTGSFPAGNVRVLGFRSSEGLVMFSVKLNSSGVLSVWRGGRFGTQLASSPAGIGKGTWYYLECKVNLHASTGSFEVRLGDSGNEPVAIMSGSGVNTTATGDTVPYQLTLGALGGSVTPDYLYWEYDDWVVMDDAGSVNNDFLGDVQIIKIRPNDIGDQSDFDPSNVDQDNFSLIDEDTEDDNETYVESNVVNAFDLYEYEDILLSGDIFACVPKPVLTKEPSGTRSHRTLCKSNGTTENGATQQPSSGSYVRRQHVYELDPDGSVAWTVAAVNAAQFGLQVVA